MPHRERRKSWGTYDHSRIRERRRNVFQKIGDWFSEEVRSHPVDYYSGYYAPRIEHLILGIATTITLTALSLGITHLSKNQPYRTVDLANVPVSQAYVSTADNNYNNLEKTISPDINFHPER
jgi:hypothetical protein